MDVTMRITDVLRKSGGKWRIVHERVSVPVDLAVKRTSVRSHKAKFDTQKADQVICWRKGPLRRSGSSPKFLPIAANTKAT